MPFVELSTLTNFTFLTGASHPEEMISRAAELGMPALAVADVNSVAGIVRAHTKAREMARDGGPRVRLIPAARIVLADGFQVTVLPRDRAAWGRLCRMLSLGQLRAPKGECRLELSDLLDWGQGMEMLVLPPDQRLTLAVIGDVMEPKLWKAQLGRLAKRFPGQVSLALSPRYDGQDRERFTRLTRLADSLGLPTVATALPFLHHGKRRRLADVLTAIRLGVTVDKLGRRALPNNEGRLRSEAEMLRLFAGFEAAVHRAGEVAARAAFSLDELSYEYPSENAPGESAAQRLARLAEAGLRWRYPEGVPDRAAAQMAHELALIGKLRYEPYFLTVHDIVAFARSRGILCQGRGSAANSVVCYALG
jgi:error-prone DNA polymerase